MIFKIYGILSFLNCKILKICYFSKLDNFKNLTICEIVKFGFYLQLSNFQIFKFLELSKLEN